MQKQITVVMKACFPMKSPTLVMEIIQPLIEREAEPDKAIETLDGYRAIERGQLAQYAD